MGSVAATIVTSSSVWLRTLVVAVAVTAPGNVVLVIDVWFTSCVLSGNAVVCTRRSNVSETPTPNLPRSQRTSPEPGAVSTPPSLADTKVVPAGSVSSITVPIAAALPVLP